MRPLGYKKYLLIPLVLAVSFFVGGFSYTAFFASDEVEPVPAPVYRGPVVQIKEVQVPVELATTTQKINKGLSGREGLPGIRGMLFVFDKPSVYRFWMVNMRFPLDMIWIENGKVVSITENIPNDFESVGPKFYTPSAPVRFVLEVNAGFAKKNNLSVGDTVIFKNFK